MTHATIKNPLFEGYAMHEWKVWYLSSSLCKPKCKGTVGIGLVMGVAIKPPTFAVYKTD